MRKLLSLLLVLGFWTLPLHAAQIQVFFSQNQTPLTPVASPGAGSYGSTQSVTLTDASAAFILYTTDGSTPACPATGTLYSGAISISVTTTLKAIGCVGADGGGVLTSVYTINAGISCTGALVLAAYMENVDDVTTGTPPGCTTNATTSATKGGSAAYSTQTFTGWPTGGGSYSLHITTSQLDSWSIPSNVSISAGTITFDVYVTTAHTYAPLIGWYINSSNWIIVESDSSNNVGIYYQGGGSQEYVATTTNSFTATTKHSILAEWSTAGVGGNTLGIKVDGGTEVYQTVGLPTITGATNLRIPDYAYASAGNIYYIDNVKVYTSWQ